MFLMDQLRSAVHKTVPFQVVIRDTSGEPIGGGFLVEERLVCTCAHVVNAALGLPAMTRAQPERSAQVGLMVCSKEVRDTSIVFWGLRLGKDLALLELDRPFERGSPAQLKEHADGPIEKAWVYRSPACPSGEGWVWVKVDPPIGDADRQLDPHDEKKPVEVGCSGGPVVTDFRSRRVAGMVYVREAGKATARMMGASVLREALEQVRPKGGGSSGTGASSLLATYQRLLTQHSFKMFVDRSQQWKALVQHLRGGKSGVLLLHGPQVQNPALFAMRLGYKLQSGKEADRKASAESREIAKIHRIYEVEVDDWGMLTEEAWRNHFVMALSLRAQTGHGTPEAPNAVRLLRQRAAQMPILFIVAGQYPPNLDLEGEYRRGLKYLAHFLGKGWSDLIEEAHPAQPVQVVVPMVAENSKKLRQVLEIFHQNIDGRDGILLGELGELRTPTAVEVRDLLQRGPLPAGVALGLTDADDIVRAYGKVFSKLKGLEGAVDWLDRRFQKCKPKK